MKTDIPNVSLFCSAVRPKIWKSYINSFLDTSVFCEIVFSGHCKHEEVFPFYDIAKRMCVNFKYIYTESIKPAQNYHTASQFCTGETISWSCDDAEYPYDVLGKAYKYWKSKNNEKLILSIQTKESGYNLPNGQLFDMKQHCFFGQCPDSPLMAPLALMSRNFFNDLGGIDRRYICGQYENDIIMRAYSQGATVEIFGGADCYIDIDHLGKSLAIGESKVEADFLNRPFAKGYRQDRQILEESWCRFNVHKLEKLIESGKRQVHQSEVYDISPIQLDMFQPYEDTDLLTKSQSNKGIWL